MGALQYADADRPQTEKDAIAETGRMIHETNVVEDEALVASVQRGIESRGYDRGQLLITPQIMAKALGHPVGSNPVTRKLKTTEPPPIFLSRNRTSIEKDCTFLAFARVSTGRSKRRSGTTA